MSQKRPTYEVPVQATLVVRLDNGKEWEARDEDFAKFGLVVGREAYWRFCDKLSRALCQYSGLTEGELVDAAVYPIRRLAEVIFCYPPEFAENPEMVETYAEIGQIERVLQAAGTEPVDPALAALRLHLFTEHKNIAALDMPGDDIRGSHQHEHAGPETIHNHDAERLHWSITTGLSLFTSDPAFDADDILSLLSLFSELATSAERDGYIPIEARR